MNLSFILQSSAYGLRPTVSSLLIAYLVEACLVVALAKTGSKRLPAEALAQVGRIGVQDKTLRCSIREDKGIEPSMNPPYNRDYPGMDPGVTEAILEQAAQASLRVKVLPQRVHTKRDEDRQAVCARFDVR